MRVSRCSSKVSSLKLKSAACTSAEAIRTNDAPCGRNFRAVLRAGVERQRRAIGSTDVATAVRCASATTAAATLMSDGTISAERIARDEAAERRARVDQLQGRGLWARIQNKRSGGG